MPWFAFPDLFDTPPPALAVVVERARKISSSPIATVNLWLDRPVLDEPFVGLPGRALQWVFDKRAVVGDSVASVDYRQRPTGAVNMANESLVALAR